MRLKTQNLSPTRWAKARQILLGENRGSVSLASAARAAGVTLKEFDQWVNRSRKKDPSDEPWVWEIADVIDESGLAQAGTLEDVAWDHAINGTPKPIVSQGQQVGEVREFNSTLLMQLLKARDQKYIDKSASLNVNLTADVDMSVLQQKWEAMQRMSELKGEEVLIDETGSVIAEDQRPINDTISFDIAELAAERSRKLKEVVEEAPDFSDFEEF